MPAPSSRDDDASLPKPISPSATNPPTATFAPSASSSAEVKGARRPTTLARTSSARPVCSSSRVCRDTSRMFINATKISRYSQ